MTQLSLLGLSGRLRLAPIEGGKQRSGASVQCDESIWSPPKFRVRTLVSAVAKRQGCFHLHCGRPCLPIVWFAKPRLLLTMLGSSELAVCPSECWNLHQLGSRKTDRRSTSTSFRSSPTINVRTLFTIWPVAASGCPPRAGRDRSPPDKLIGANAMRSFLALSLLMILCASASAATVHHTIPRRHVIDRPSQGWGYAVPRWAYAAPPPTVHYDDIPSYNDPSKFGGSTALPIEN